MTLQACSAAQAHTHTRVRTHTHTHEGGRERERGNRIENVTLLSSILLLLGTKVLQLVRSQLHAAAQPILYLSPNYLRRTSGHAQERTTLLLSSD